MILLIYDIEQEMEDKLTTREAIEPDQFQR